MLPSVEKNDVCSLCHTPLTPNRNLSTRPSWPGAHMPRRIGDELPQWVLGYVHVEPQTGCGTKDMDARAISAFTRVFRRAMRGHDGRESGSI